MAGEVEGMNLDPRAWLPWLWFMGWQRIHDLSVRIGAECEGGTD